MLHVAHFEGVARTGEAHLFASWDIVHLETETVVAQGSTEYRPSGWVAGDYAELVRLLDAGLAHLADALVARLERVVAAPLPER